jgi:hypothetical protein
MQMINTVESWHCDYRDSLTFRCEKCGIREGCAAGALRSAGFSGLVKPSGLYAGFWIVLSTFWH